jgi:hypothetical protein
MFPVRYELGFISLKTVISIVIAAKNSNLINMRNCSREGTSRNLVSGVMALIPHELSTILE